jgi:ubiquitin carboxyl-terminal hydrolase 22/27/51
LGDEKFCSVVKGWELESNENGGYRKIPGQGIEVPLVKWTKTDVKKDSNNLEKLLELFFGLELLKENSQFKCENCLKSNPEQAAALQINAMRGYLVDGHPETFVINLKYYKMEEFDLKKIDTHIAFDLKLDMSKYTVRRDPSEPKLIYELYAVVVHKGRVDGGHYMCYVKHVLPKGEKWVCFNDDAIQEVDPEDVLKKQAYILFYKKSK